VRSWNTPDPINTIPAHSGAISDFDVYGNRLISCGYTSRLVATNFMIGSNFRLGKLHSDPFLKVYDIRNFRSQMPVSVMFPPVFCRFANPYFDGQLLVVSKVVIRVDGEKFFPDFSFVNNLKFHRKTMALNIGKGFSGVENKHIQQKKFKIFYLHRIP
jgi:hypothetical protein